MAVGTGEHFIGNWGTSGGRNFAGALDEIRVSGVPRSELWIQMGHQNVMNYRDFITHGVPSTIP